MAASFLVCCIAFLGLLCSAEGLYEAVSANAVPHQPILTVIETSMEKCMCLHVLCCVTCVHGLIHYLGNVIASA